LVATGKGKNKNKKKTNKRGKSELTPHTIQARRLKMVCPLFQERKKMGMSQLLSGAQKEAIL
jgi:hypothetical protein